MAEPSTSEKNAGAEVAAKSRKKAGMARGDFFQDIIGGLCLLAVLFGSGKSVKIESAFNKNDRFDDVILKTDEETICIQVKYSADYQLSRLDLSDRSGKLNIEEMVESAKERQAGDAGTRFVVLTTYEEPRPSEVSLSEESETLSLFGDFQFQTQTLDSNIGLISDDSDIELIFNVPYLENGFDSEGDHNLDRIELFQEVLLAVEPLFDQNENPRIGSAKNLIRRTITLAQRTREDPGEELTRDIIADRLRISPSTQEIPQSISVDNGCIIPEWVQDLQQSRLEPGERRLVEGDPGSGKSTGIELFCNKVVEQSDYRIGRYYLYDPKDRPDQAETRRNPAWFRDQLAAELLSMFPEAFSSENYPIWTGRSDLQGYINTAAEWAEKHGEQALLIVDGLDHALPNSEGANSREDVANTVIEEIGEISFPRPLCLLLVGRKLSADARNVLNPDTRQPVPRWTKNEVTSYFKQNGVSVNSKIVNDSYEVSKGLPVITAHLLRSAEAYQGKVEDGIRQAIADAPDVHGELQEYYEEIWEPTAPHSRDILTLTSVSPTALNSETIHQVLDLPWIQKQTHLDAGVLAHTLKEVESHRYRVFHESFREFIEKSLSPEEHQRVNGHLCDFYLGKFKYNPLYPERLQYHAENSGDTKKLRSLATVDNVIRWWRQGIHSNQIADALDLAFEAAVKIGDYHTLLDCVVLGSTMERMMSTYVDERLHYFIAVGDKERAMSYLDQARRREPGNTGILRSMSEISKKWPSEIDPDWLKDWIVNYMDRESYTDWDPEAYFDTAGRIFESDDFWHYSGKIRTDDQKQGQFTHQVLRAVRENQRHLENRPSPPGWMFNNIPETLEAAETIGYQLPENWKRQFVDELSSCEKLSPAALHTAMECGASESKIEACIDTIQLGEPQRMNDNYPRFSEGYYLGAILAELGKSPDALPTMIANLANEQVIIRQLDAMIGAAATRRNADSVKRWVNATLEMLIGIFETGELSNPRLEHLDYTTYKSILEVEVNELGRVLDYGSDELTEEVFTLANSEEWEDRLVNSLAKNILRERDSQYPDNELPSIWEEKFSEIVTAGPTGEPPSRRLIELALRAAEEGHDDYAEKYYKKAVERGFRYGYHKDIFLSDVWEGVEDVVDGDWTRHHLGTSIQLANWSNLLHEITDGDETGYIEYEIISSLLDDEVVDYQTATRAVTDRGTAKRLWKWRLRNPQGISKRELEGLIYVEEKELMAYQYSSISITYFVNATTIAEANGWDDLAKRALRVIAESDHFEDRLNTEQVEKIEEAADKYGIDIPDDVGARDESEDRDIGPKERPSSIDKKLHQSLVNHPDGKPVTQAVFAELSTEDVVEVGKLVIGKRVYHPTVAVPVAETLIERDEREMAVSLLEKTIAEKRLLRWDMFGREPFRQLSRVLLEIQDDKALQTVLEAWNRSDLNAKNLHCILPQLVWIVKRTEGDLAAEEFVSHAMHWLRRLLEPHENYMQQWGVLAANNNG